MSNVWVWCSWIERSVGAQVHKAPVYTLIAETSRPPCPATQPKTKAVGPQAALHFAEAVLPRLPPGLATGADRNVDLRSTFPAAPVIPLSGHRRIVRPTDGGVTHTDHWISGTDPDDVVWSSDVAEGIASLLSEQLNIAFHREMLQHIGGVDLIGDLESVPKFGAEIESRPGGSPNTLVLRRAKSLVSPMAVAIAFLDAGELLSKRLEQWPVPQGTRLRIQMPLDRCGYELAVYNDAGELTFEESRSEPGKIRISTSVGSEVLLLSDRLAQRSASLGSEAAAAASRSTRVHVMGHTSARAGTAAGRMRVIRTQIESFLPDASLDRWFTRSVQSELDLIAYLNRLMSDPGVREAVIVDPFFGVDAVQGLLPRVERHGLPLTIIASWGRTDPDDATRIAGSSAEATAIAARRAVRVLERTEPLLAAKVRFINVVASNGDQAFHDRYLLLRMGEGRSQVFLLSNSMNGMAANYPFCIAELRGRAALRADDYIRGLENGRDTSTPSASIRVTVDWPSNGAALV